MADGSVRAYGYRWALLLVFMLVGALNQALWITFAPITSDAMRFYGTSDIAVGLLSLVFMAVYILLFLPSAWLIDNWGFRRAVSLGAVIQAVFAVTRGVFANNYTLVFISQIGIAMGQPLILRAITKLAARWFLKDERATAVGLGTLSMYLGVLAGLIVTPLLFARIGMQGMLLSGGIVSAAAAVLFVLMAREHPPTPPGPAGQEERALMFDGLKSMMRQKDFLLLLVVFFIGLGMFNGITTWIEEIVGPRGFSPAQAGVAGGAMLIGGIIGAVAIPLMSDARRRRKPFIILALAGLLPGLVGITFASSYWLLLASAFVFGFFLLSAGPIGFQYGAEITLPAPEGTSNTMLLLMGQVSGIVFIFGMDALKSPQGSMSVSLIGLVVLTVIAVLLSLFLKESPIRDRTS
jgi:MFS family permease